jgi:hypothetical protein
MRFGRMMRGTSARLATLLVSGTLFLGIVQGTNDGPQETQNWSRAQAAYVDQSPRKLSISEMPPPPSPFVLVETSSKGTALALEIASRAQDLGQILLEGSTSDGEATLETLHEVICFAISGLLEKRIDPGDPRGMATTINVYLAADDLPRLDYAQARKPLEKIYKTFEEALSTDELSRDVAEAILCS